MRLRGFLWIIIIAAFGLLSIGGRILGLYIDWLWFREVQFTSVFVTVLRTQVLLGAVTAVAFFLILYAQRAPGLAARPARRRRGGDDALGLPGPEVLEPYVRRLALPVSVVMALFVGWVGTDRWELVLKALNPTPFGVRDPLFDRDVAFYVFQLPLWNSLYGWLMGVLVVSGLAAVAVYVCTRGMSDLLQGPGRSPDGPGVTSWCLPRSCSS